MAGASLAHISERILNRPLLLHPQKILVIQSVLAGRIGLQDPGLSPEASQFTGETIDTDGTGKRTGRPMFRRTDAGVAIIDVLGTLVNRGAWIGASSGLTSYEGIQAQIAAVRADPNTHSVILDIASPGGEAVGAFETAAAVRDLAKSKRTVAVVNGMAASAAYAIASGATEIVTTETGVVGSIGVVLLHADYSAALAEDGIKPTLIFAGAHKVDGNPFEPLTDAVKTDLQAEVNAFYEKFLATVEAGRGSRTSRATARATEARTFIGDAAVKAGLADRVGTFESVLADLSSRKGSLSPSHPSQNRTSSMSHTAHYTAGDANERISAIVNHTSIKGSAARMSAAINLAISTPEMSVDGVVAFVTSHVGDSKSEIIAAATRQFAATNGAFNYNARRPVKIDANAIYEARRQATKDRSSNRLQTRLEDYDGAASSSGADMAGVDSRSIYEQRRTAMSSSRSSSEG